MTVLQLFGPCRCFRGGGGGMVWWWRGSVVVVVVLSWWLWVIQSTGAQTKVTPSFGSRRLGTFENLRTIDVSIKKQRRIILKKLTKGPNNMSRVIWAFYRRLLILLLVHLEPSSSPAACCCWLGVVTWPCWDGCVGVGCNRIIPGPKQRCNRCLGPVVWVHSKTSE